MLKKAEVEKLQRYEDALESLPLDAQFAKTQAVKSTKNLERFGAANAPENLTRRFSEKISNLLGYGSTADLNFFEQGRVYALAHYHEPAIRELEQADKNGNRKAVYYLAASNLEMGNYYEASRYYKEALAKKINVEESLIGLTTALLGLGRTAEAKKYAARTLKKEIPQWQKDYFTTILGGGSSGDGPKVSGGTVVAHIDDNPGEGGHETDLERLFKEMIKKGDLKSWKSLGNHYREQGRIKEAMRCFVKTVILGDFSVDLFNGENGCPEGTIEALYDHVNVEPWNVYPLLAKGLYEKGRTEEALRCIDKLLKIRANYGEGGFETTLNNMVLRDFYGSNGGYLLSIIKKPNAGFSRELIEYIESEMERLNEMKNAFPTLKRGKEKTDSFGAN